jgi:hypothetical protein
MANPKKFHRVRQVRYQAAFGAGDHNGTFLTIEVITRASLRNC